jgi:hypothetical protein
MTTTRAAGDESACQTSRPINHGRNRTHAAIGPAAEVACPAPDVVERLPER